jgi:hypothetical protein
MEGFAHHGHYVTLDPQQVGDSWEAHVEVVVHAKGQKERINYHDHVQRYPTRDAALEASRALGKMAVENFILPASGEGEYHA